MEIGGKIFHWSPLIFNIIFLKSETPWKNHNTKSILLKIRRGLKLFKLFNCVIFVCLLTVLEMYCKLNEQMDSKR